MSTHVEQLSALESQPQEGAMKSARARSTRCIYPRKARGEPGEAVGYKKTDSYH